MSFTQPLSKISPMPKLAEVHELLESSLRGNWFLRVEHADEVAAHQTQWNSWHSARHGMQNPEPLIQDILNCHAQHPEHAIRLHAECSQPQTRMVYWVYLPERDRQQVMINSKAGILSLADAQSGPANSAQRSWGVMALIGMLLASLFLFNSSLITS